MKEVTYLLERFPVLGVCKNEIAEAIAILIDCYQKGGKLLVCGNGGSAADSLHIVGELMKGFVKQRRLPPQMKEQLCRVSAHGEFLYQNLQGALPAISLVNEVFPMDSMYTYPKRPFDHLSTSAARCFTTSGNSENVIYAAEVARAKGMKVIALTGQGGGKMSACSDVVIAVPEKETYKVQELHLPIYHAICIALENAFFEDGADA